MVKGILGEFVPDWLPAEQNQRDAARAGLMNFGAAMLANANQGFGGALGRGLIAGTQGYQNTQAQQQQQALQGLQMNKMRREAQISDAMTKAGQESTGQNGFDTQGFIDRVMFIDPLKGLSLRSSMAKDAPFSKIDPKDYTAESVARFAQTNNYADLTPVRKMEVAPSGVAYNPYQTQPGQVFNDPNKIMGIGPDGKPFVNTQLVNAKRDIARSGATNVSVNTEKSLLNGIAGDLGKSIGDARSSAQAAAGTINTLSRLNDALNSGNVVAGPGSTFKQYGLQLGNMLGINGKTANDKLLNTRQAIQSLAQLELDAAQQMKGQGQITENERSIIRRAAAGEIDQMTSDELRVLVGVLDRSARYKIQTYQTQVQPLQSNPDAAALAPFLGIEMPSPLQGPTQKSGIKFLGFDGE